MLRTSLDQNTLLASLKTIKEDALALIKRSNDLAINTSELRKQIFSSPSLLSLEEREKLPQPLYSVNNLGSLTEEEEQKYLTNLNSLANEAKEIEKKSSVCRKQVQRIKTNLQSDTNAKEIVNILSLSTIVRGCLTDLEELRDMIKGKQIYEYTPMSVCVKRNREVTGNAAVYYIQFQVKKDFAINAGDCDVVEETFLKLAGVTEKPWQPCVFHNDLDSFDDDKLQQNHSPNNSVFFQLPLLDPDSVNRLKIFAEANKIEFFDYSHIIGEEYKNQNIKLIRIDADSAKHILCAKIVDYLQKHPQETLPYLKKTCEKLHPERNKDQIAEIEQRIKNIEAIRTSSWNRFFSDHRLAISVSAAVGVAVTGYVMGSML